MADRALAARMEFRVSVIIPVYKAGAFVEAAVASALALPEVAEVLLVEDGSPDDSLRICERLASIDPRVRVLRHPDGGNHGAGAARNLGLKHATCPFVAFLDADDRYLPNRFDRDREVFASEPAADGVYSAIGTLFHGDADTKRFRDRFTDELTTVSRAVPPEALFNALLTQEKGFGHIHLDGLTVKRGTLHRMGIAFDSSLRLHQDSDFILRLAHGARLHAGEIASPVALRGVHGGNRITAPESMAPTRRLLYLKLEAWSRTVRMSVEERRILIARRVYYQMDAEQGATRSLAALGPLVRHLWLLKWVKVREQCFARALGTNSRLAKGLRALTWRIFGDGGGSL